MNNWQITVGYRRPQWIESSERFLDTVGPFVAKKGNVTFDELELLVRSFSWWNCGIRQRGVNVSWQGQQGENFLLKVGKW